MEMNDEQQHMPVSRLGGFFSGARAELPKVSFNGRHCSHKTSAWELRK